MVVTANAVNVAVGNFFLGGGANIFNGDIEGELFPRQGVIAVDGGVAAVNIGNYNGNGAVIGLGFEAHAHFHFGVAKGFEGDGLNQAFVIFAISLIGGDIDLERISGRFSGERRFQTRNDVVGAVKIGQRALAAGGVELHAIFIAHGVMKRNNTVILDSHKSRLNSNLGAHYGRLGLPSQGEYREVSKKTNAGGLILLSRRTGTRIVGYDQRLVFVPHQSGCKSFMLQVLLNVIFPVFCCVLIGYIWGKSRFDYATEFVTRLVTNVGAPCLIVATINESTLNWQDFLVMAKLSFAVMAGFALLGLIIFKLLKMDFRALSLAVIFPNTGNMGLSLALFAFGEEGLALALIIFVVIALVHFACGDFVLGQHRSLREGLHNLIRQPIILATLFSMIQIGLDFDLPTPLATTTKLLGGMTIPIMLVTLGLSLATLRFADMGKGFLVAFLRVPGGLLVALAVIALSGADGLVAKVLILQSVMPSAVFNYFFALKYKREVETVASSVVMSTVLSFLILPPLLWYLLGDL